jgi:hypothetical protein
VAAKNSAKSEAVRRGSASRRPLACLLIGTVIIAAIFVFRANFPPPPPPPPSPGPGGGGPKDVSITAEAAQDSWETETFAAAAAKQFERLGQVLTDPNSIADFDYSSLIAQEFDCTKFRPQQMTSEFSDGSIQVFRGAIDESAQTGTEALVHALRDLAKPLEGKRDIRTKFKIVSVELAETVITTNVVYQASGRSDSDALQQSAVWHCRWKTDSSSNSPLLVGIRVTDYEEVVGRSPHGTLFADCTEAIFGDDPQFRRQFVRGIDYWRSGIQAQYGVYPYGHHGIAIGDVNGDGLEDLYVCQPAGLPNCLYLQNLDGTVTNAAEKMGVDWLDRSRGALFIDLDNDGDQDLVIAINALVLVMSNEGNGTFKERTTFRTRGDPGSLAAADYDLDGDLDVYIVSYGKRFMSDGESSGPIPYHDANNGGRNVLMRNDGQWVFTDVTKQCGIDENNERWSFAASWEDYDGDGDPDLYVANDFGRNNLYRNDGGKFSDVAAEAGVEDIAAGMSVSWGDFNQDGRMDLYVGNMFSSAGQRIANQRRFQAAANDDVRGQFQRHARGNSLFLNVGDGTFQDVSEQAGVTLGRWAWASPFVDINNDGLEDIVVANGFVTGSNTGDL